MNPLPEFTFRCYHGEQDLPAMLDVFRSSHQAGLDMNLDETFFETLEEITGKYRHLVNCDPYRDVLIAESGELVVAYARVNWAQREASGDRVYLITWYIRPGWDGLGLEKTLLARCQERVRQMIQEQDKESPDGEAPDGESPDGKAPFSGRRFFEAQAMDYQPELCKLLEEDGFKAVRWGSKMTCPNLHHIPDAPLPEGMEVRPVRPEHYRAIWDALLDAFHDDPGYAQPGDEDYAAWLQSAQFQPELWQVAWEDAPAGIVIGMVLNYITHEPGEAGPGTAWTEDICVRGPWRRRGLARALLARSMRMFREMGFHETTLGVDLNHPDGARQFYESMGYRLVSVLNIYEKPVVYSSLLTNGL